MDNFSVRSKRNFHNLAAKPKRMHLLDEPNGYASAMVKSSLSHQMRFMVQKLEEKSSVLLAIRMCCRLSCSETTRVSRLAGSFLPTVSASRTARVTLPANASARELRCFWTCAAAPYAQLSCASGVRGSTSC